VPPIQHFVAHAASEI